MNKHAPLKFDGWPTRSQLEEIRPASHMVFREQYRQSPDTRRGTGRTLALLQMLPKNAVFVVQNERMFFHVKYLCEMHGLDKPHRLVTPRWFTEQGWRGQQVTVVLDHDLEVTEREREAIDEARASLAIFDIGTGPVPRLTERGMRFIDQLRKEL